MIKLMQGSALRANCYWHSAGRLFCDAAAGESCPFFSSVPYPANAAGTVDEVTALFDRAYVQLERRVKTLAALLIETIPQLATLAAIGKDQL